MGRGLHKADWPVTVQCISQGPFPSELLSGCYNALKYSPPQPPCKPWHTLFPAAQWRHLACVEKDTTALLMMKHLTRSRLTKKAKGKRLEITNDVVISETDHDSVMRLHCTLPLILLQKEWLSTSFTYQAQNQRCSRRVTARWGALGFLPEFHWISQGVSFLDPTFPKEKQRCEHLKINCVK